MIWNICQDSITGMIDVFDLAFLAVKVIGNLAAELDFVAVLLTEEPRWIKLKVCAEI